jgi:hypothetical protein
MFQRVSTRASRAVVVVFGLLLTAACGAPDREAHGMEDPYEVEGEGGAGGGEAKGCKEGATHHCRIKIGEHAGVVTCVDGFRECIDGAWSECEPYEG